MPRNIELKARLRDPEGARQIAERLATERIGMQQQRDTYFSVPHGRLKLREIAGQPAQLVWYERPDSPDAKASDYQLLSVAEPERLCKVLADALGIRVIVDKRREIFLYHNVRIHLDEVAGLGSFLEFEAVLSDAIDDERGREQVAFLSREFGLLPEDLLLHSYSDMLEEA